MSITVVADVAVIGAVEPPLAEGQRIIVFGKPEFWTGRGTLSLRAKEIRAVGLGELLAQLARLRELLTAEGLFAADRKKPLPFLPRRVGLICGRNSAAMHDVLVNARERWPSVQFVVREVAVQGVQAVSGVSEALAELDAQVAQFADTLAAGAIKAIKWTKLSVNIGLKQLATSIMDASLAYEAMSNVTVDHQEAVNAFREKRKPVFVGR
jgi:exodeoxyribonuclease VII large subunit